MLRLLCVWAQAAEMNAGADHSEALLKSLTRAPVTPIKDRPIIVLSRISGVFLVIFQHGCSI